MKAACPDDRRSTTAYSVFLSTNLLSWGTKKEATVSRSSAEAEYKALAVTASELLWLSYVLCDLGLRFSLPSLLYCNNISVTLYSIGLFTRSSMPEGKMMSNLIITSFGRKLLVAILRSFTCGQRRRWRMCSLKASLPLASSSRVTTGYSTMGMSRGKWPYRSKGQVLGKCSTKVLVNRLIQLMFTTALSRRAQIQLFPDWLLHHVYLLPLYPQKSMPHYVKGRESSPEIPASHYY